MQFVCKYYFWKFTKIVVANQEFLNSTRVLTWLSRIVIQGVKRLGRNSTWFCVDLFNLWSLIYVINKGNLNANTLVPSFDTR